MINKKNSLILILMSVIIASCGLLKKDNGILSNKKIKYDSKIKHMKEKYKEIKDYTKKHII